MSVECGHALPDAVLAGLSKLVGTWLGLHFPQERWVDLNRGVRAACKESGLEDTLDYAERFLSSAATREEKEILAAHLTVGETYFFREKRILEIFESHILPLHPGSEFRVWSAGCATGEEPYSLAMVLNRIVPDWNVTILATDLNTRSLRKASDGVYGEWSFRGTPKWIRARYFSPVSEGRWAIHPSIRKMVTFAWLNLVEDTIPDAAQAMDMIFCRNVIMYFHPDAARKVVGRLYRSLNQGGWLAVSPAETSHMLFREFTSVGFSGATLYRKEPVRQTAPPPFSAVFEQPIDNFPDRPAIPIKRAAGDRAPAMLRLARVCANRGQLREALEWCEKAIASGKSDSKAHYLRAAILEESGSLEEAARSLRRALYLDPNFAIAHFALGNLASRRGNIEQSAKHFANALQVLAAAEANSILPESGGLTAGRLKELIARRIHG